MCKMPSDHVKVKMKEPVFFTHALPEGRGVNTSYSVACNKTLETSTVEQSCPV